MIYLPIGMKSETAAQLGRPRAFDPETALDRAMHVFWAKGYEGALHPEEALSRKKAIRFYTANNAYLLFQEKETGSIEVGKLADLVVLDTDILKCPVDEIRNTRALQTYVAGKLVFERR